MKSPREKKLQPADRDKLDHPSDAPEEGAYHATEGQPAGEPDAWPPENQTPSEAAGEDFE